MLSAELVTAALHSYTETRTVASTRASRDKRSIEQPPRFSPEDIVKWLNPGTAASFECTISLLLVFVRRDLTSVVSTMAMGAGRWDLELRAPRKRPLLK